MTIINYAQSETPQSRGWLLREFKNFRYTDKMGEKIAKWAIVYKSEKRGLNLLMHTKDAETKGGLLERIHEEIDRIERNP